MGVTGDTPRKINISTNPSPSVPLGTDEPDVATGQGRDGAHAPGAGQDPREEFSSSPRGDHLGGIGPDSTPETGRSDETPDAAGYPAGPATAELCDAPAVRLSGGDEDPAPDAAGPASGAASRNAGVGVMIADGAKMREKAPLVDENPSSGT